MSWLAGLPKKDLKMLVPGSDRFPAFTASRSGYRHACCSKRCAIVWLISARGNSTKGWVGNKVRLEIIDTLLRSKENESG